MNKRDYHLKRKFGITDVQYGELYSKQGECCAICGSHSSTFKNRLAVDHDHTSGEIRGLLCFRCNKFVVGRYRKGIGLDLLRRAVQYLDREYTGWLVPIKKKKKRRKRKKK